MSSSVSSSASTAWQTALTSARSNVNSNVQPAGNGDAPPPSSYATMARLAQAGGYGSRNHTQPQSAPRRSPSVASSSSSVTSSYGLADDSSSASSGDSPSQRTFQSAPIHTGPRQPASGFYGSANVARPSAPGSSYAQAGSRSSSRASSTALDHAPSTYANTTLARTSSHSGLSGSESDLNGYSSRSQNGRGNFSSSRSQTSIDSEGPMQLAAHGTTLLRDIARPVLNNASEWADAFQSISTDARKKAKDEEELARGIEALGLNPDLTERRQPTPVRSNLPPPPETGAWTFKKTIPIPRGATIDPERLRGPSPEYLEKAALGSDLLPLNAFIGKRPKLLVLDLNQTLVTRKKATSKGAKNATPRPYLSAFLEYICGSDKVSDGVFQRRFNVMIWSSAEASNVQTMCENMCLFTNAGTQAPLLVDVWDRSSMDLTLEQFNAKYPTIKDLNKPWRILRWNPIDPASPNPALLRQTSENVPPSSASSVSSSQASDVRNGVHPPPSPAPSSVSSASASTASTATYTKKDLRWSQLDTVLIDDTPAKASLQPFNHLCIPSWKPPSKEGISSLSSGSSSYMPYNGGMVGPGEYKIDTCLVQIVAMLERLRHHSNVSAAIRSSQFEGLGRDERGDAWAKAGFGVLKAKGIKAPKDFDSTWAVRVLHVSD